MVQRSIAAGMIVVLMMLVPAPAQAKEGICSECGMLVDQKSPFSAKITGRTDVLSFCDIGDLFAYVKRKGLQDGSAEVRDFPTGAWINARTAFYVTSTKLFHSPMGWGIAAFTSREEASRSGNAMDFDSVLKMMQ